MILHSSLPYSLIKYGLPFDYPKLRKSARVDVVILGGGISGALTAYYLSKENIDCAIIDKRMIGLGSTCASTNLIQYELDVPLFKLIKLRGEKQAVRAYHLCKDAISNLKEVADEVGLNEYQFKNSLYFTTRRGDVQLLKKEFSTREKYGFQVEWLEENDLRRDYGLSAPAAILSHHGAQTNAYLFTHALLQQVIKKGAAVYDDTQIVSVEHSEKKITLKTDDGYFIEAEKLVYATGYEVTEFINKKIVKLQTTFAIAGSTVDQSFSRNDNAIMWNTDNPYLYIRTTSDGRIIIGGRDTSFRRAQPGALLQKKSRQLAEDFKKLFPSIPFQTEFEWSGVFGTTKDGLPYIGLYKKLPNSLFSLGFGGNGITFSEVGARIIADLIIGKKNPDAEIFSFERR